MSSRSPPALPRGWKAEWNDRYHEWYYVNLRTEVSQWEKPVRAVYGSWIRSVNEVPRGLPEGWEAEWDSKYKEWYYANIYTGFSQWERPSEPARRFRGRSERMARHAAVNSVKGKDETGSMGMSERWSGQKIDVKTKTRPKDGDVTGTASSTRDRSAQQNNADTKPSQEDNLSASVSALLKEFDKDTRLQRSSDAATLGVKSGMQTLYTKLFYPQTFRLLELHGGSGSQPLSGTLLQPVLLDSNLTYDALSYRWSEIDLAHPNVISINNVQFRIGPNLHAALLQFRLETVSRFIWVDQICIKQDDKEDKIRQIKMMADIYSKARKVLIWLGETGNQSDVAMEFFPIFVECTRQNEATASLEQSTESPADVIEYGGTLAVAMEGLFRRPWFGRLWTLQEAALGRDAEVWCGNRSFPFQVLETFQRGFDNDLYGHWANALSLIRSGNSGADPENPDRPHNAHIHVISILKGIRTSSVRILNSLRYLDCSDDKDRILSVLRFLSADLVEKIVEQDEPLPADLYQLVAVYEIQRGQLEYLCAAGLSQHRMSFATEPQSSSDPCLILPSWVPDWTFRHRTHSYWVDNHVCLLKRKSPLFAAGGLPLPEIPQWHPEDPKVLHVRGIVIASRVEECATPFRFPQIPENLGDHPAKLGAAQAGYQAFQTYIGSCMELATKCVPNYGLSNIIRACRRSLVGGMMPEGSGNTSTGICVPATDQVVDALFEDFQKQVSHFEDFNEAMNAMSIRLAQIGDGNPFDITDEDKAQMARFMSATEAMKGLSKRNNLMQAMADACKGRRFFITDCERYMGIAPDITLPGDRICLIPGCCAPFVIRAKGDRYQLIGECYVAGMMNGEVMARERDSLETIIFE